jgi:hypothetical protein
VLLRRAFGEEAKSRQHAPTRLVARDPSALGADAERREAEARRGARSDAVTRVSFGRGFARQARAV